MTTGRLPTAHGLAASDGLPIADARELIRRELRTAARRLWPLTLVLIAFALYGLWAELSGNGPTGLGFAVGFLMLCTAQWWLIQRLAAPRIRMAARRTAKPTAGCEGYAD